MQLQEFFEQGFPHSCPVLIFGVWDESNFPIVFSRLLIEHYKATDQQITSLDVTLLPPSQIIAQLETTFLGINLTYYLRGMHEIDNKYRQKIVNYLTTYSGPHRIILFITQSESNAYFEKKIIIEIPEKVNPTLFISLFTFLNKTTNNVTTSFIQKLCDSYSKISLDQACMIIFYLKVLGKNSDCSQILKSILTSEKSLFKLSQYFFSKDSVSFFNLWVAYEEEYPVTFWCTFWSEQLWRAYYAYYFMKQQQFPQAKNIAFRLPFTFLQKDWKKTSIKELKNAHDFLYALDITFKNNRDAKAGFDLFFTKFFCNNF